MASMGKNTLFMGRKLAGQVCHTFVGGKWVVKDSKSRLKKEACGDGQRGYETPGYGD